LAAALASSLRDAKYKGYEVAEVFREEGKSAKTILGKPELLRLLDYCRKNKKEVRAVFVYRLDSLSRQTSKFLALRQRFYGMGPKWLGVVDDFRTFGWVERIRFPALILDKYSLFLLASAQYPMISS
jgi:hypothetical protein